jgi:hypothetical protein
MNWMVIQSLQRQTNQEAKRHDMNPDLNPDQDADHEMYDMPNKGTIFKPKSLLTKERHIGHQVSLVRMGARK